MKEPDPAWQPMSVARRRRFVTTGFIKVHGHRNNIIGSQLLPGRLRTTTGSVNTPYKHCRCEVSI